MGLKPCILVLFVGLVSSKTCPDGSLCDTGDTCCKLSSGKYTCCPVPNAVCCPDREHCCPAGYSCDNETDACKPSAEAFVQTVLLPRNPGSTTQKSAKGYALCGIKGEHVCLDGHTCCPQSFKKAGNFTCCPAQDAVCCADGKHCCPRGTTCDLAAGLCARPKVGTPKLAPVKLLKKEQAKPVKATVAGLKGSTYVGKSSANIVCPPKYFACPDRINCCPDNYTCTFSGECVALRRRMPRTVPCSDKIHHCPDSYTCCTSPDGSWSCCPLKNAVCCPDNVHCCPKGTTCDTSHGSCKMNGLLPVPWSTKIPAKSSRSEAQKVAPIQKP
ncbi:hypothetical protein HPB48_019722 [Haemaphysalis longicornis]|uniref:Granulins domain-containing protein n=1 Tax=Haemaphysalis longicornis TaxID=44386 RepID=A0A9J6G5W9_HAELO|nr:hypothetical protein HPB48_019722 [Haemaphysalis longicornis]